MAIMYCDYISKTLRYPFQMLRDDFRLFVIKARIIHKLK